MKTVIQRDGIELHLSEGDGDGPPLTTLEDGSQVTLGGDRMTITDHPDGSATITFDDKGTGRVCGSCTLCCKLVPVQSMNKPAGVRCPKLSYAKRCTIYANRPRDCRTWSCRWLADADTAGMPRPDRAHYVIDIAWDSIVQEFDDGRPNKTCTVLQVWVDPAFPSVAEEPELRRFMEHVAEKYGAGTILRTNSSAGTIVFPPQLTGDGTWHHVTSNILSVEAMELKKMAIEAAAREAKP